ncbi:hypothetical protein EGW08_015344, partial [Elysia chlorotica]
HHKGPQPLARKLWSAAHRLVPDDGKVDHAAEVLCDGDRVVEVEDHVPPAARDKHSLTGTLEDLHLGTHTHKVRTLYLGVNVCEPSDGLVLLFAPDTGRDLQQLTRHVGRQQTPPGGTFSPLVTNNEGVPGACPERINVDTSAGSWRTHHKPSAVKKMLNTNRDIVESHLAVVRIKYVQRTVVLSVAHVVFKIFHLDLHRVALVIFPALEPLVAVFLCQPLKVPTYPGCPFVGGGPVLLDVGQHHGRISALKLGAELPQADLTGVDSLDVVVDEIVAKIKSVHILLSIPAIRFSVQFW